MSKLMFDVLYTSSLNNYEYDKMISGTLSYSYCAARGLEIRLN